MCCYISLWIHLWKLSPLCGYISENDLFVVNLCKYYLLWYIRENSRLFVHTSLRMITFVDTCLIIISLLTHCLRRRRIQTIISLAVISGSPSLWTFHCATTIFMNLSALQLSTRYILSTPSIQNFHTGSIRYSNNTYVVHQIFQLHFRYNRYSNISYWKHKVIKLFRKRTPSIQSIYMWYTKYSNYLYGENQIFILFILCKPGIQILHGEHQIFKLFMWRTIGILNVHSTSDILTIHFGNTRYSNYSYTIHQIFELLISSTSAVQIVQMGNTRYSNCSYVVHEIF